MTRPKATKPRAKYVDVSCTICGTVESFPPARARIRKVCSNWACAVECRKRTTRTVIDQRTPEQREAFRNKLRNRVTTVCACGCGTVIETTPYRLSRTDYHAICVDRAHLSVYRNRLAQERNPRVWSEVRYGAGWRDLATSIRERDRVCRDCGKTPEENGSLLDVHHIVPYRTSRSNDPSNLKALCDSCHITATNRERKLYPLTPMERNLFVVTCSECGTQWTVHQRGRKTCSDRCRTIRKLRLERDRYRREHEHHR